MKTVRLTMAQATVRYLAAQRGVRGGKEVPLFAGVWAIFGHGNVARKRYKQSTTHQRIGV